MIKDNEYHNIVFSPDMQERVNGTVGYSNRIVFENSVMEEVVTKLAKAQPTWRIVMVYGTAREYFKCGKIEVTIDGELVGGVQSDYIRGNYGVRVWGHKLDNPVRSSNPARALSACRKTFLKRNSAERLHAAEKQATSIINHVRYDQNSKVSTYEREISAMAFRFAMGLARDKFVDNLLEFEKDKVRKYDEASLHMATITAVYEAFDKNKTALIVRDSDRYIVKIGDDVSLYAPTELPDQFKGKVGMLKLCEDGQMVDNVGCRVTEEVFVVLVDEGANE